MSDRCCEGARPLNFSRRYFLKRGGIAMVGLSAMPTFLQRAIAATPATTGKKQFVVLFQRGAADGLNIVVPFGEPNYYRLRPTIAIPQPRRGGFSRTGAGSDGSVQWSFYGTAPSVAGEISSAAVMGSPASGSPSCARNLGANDAIIMQMPSIMNGPT